MAITVAQLIEKLKTMPADARVVYAITAEDGDGFMDEWHEDYDLRSMFYFESANELHLT